MNCEDISRIVDTGSIRELSDAGYGAAESHARQCRGCAAIWGVQSRLARVRVPAMPPEVVTRLQMLASLPERTARAPSLRRLTLIGSLVALAAAAGVWIWLRADSHKPQPAASVVAAPPATAAAPQLPHENALPPAPEIAVPAPDPKKHADALPFGQLPLVPQPAAVEQDPDKLSLAQRKAVERHPELVQGPELDDAAIFFVSLVMRTDGTVLNSAAELASIATATEVSERLQRTLPVGGGETLVSFLTRGQQLTRGNAARAGVFLRAMIIRDGFDLARSDVRVREILGHKYDALALPANGDATNKLTVLLSNDGRVLREKVELGTMQTAGTWGDVGVAASQEEAIASKLDIDVEQIGAIGETSLEPGTLRVVTDQDGFRRLEGRRLVLVRYAWERQSGQSAVRTPFRAPAEPPDFDAAAALTVVKQLFPDAFSHAEPAPAEHLGPIPTVVFTASGEVIRFGRVQMRNGVSTDKLLQEQLVPGISTGLDRIVRLTDNTGATALVHFAWKMSR